MTDVRIPGMSTTYRLVSKLYAVLGRAMPAILQDLTPAERTVILGLMEAMRLFLEEAPFPGTDDDPGTQA